MRFRAGAVVWAAMLAGSMGVAEAAWLGGDDLPARPLACDGDAPAEAATPKPYDGGTPGPRPPRDSDTMTVIDVARINGVAYYAAVAEGMREAAEELGDIAVRTDGPSQISAVRQVATIEDHVTAGVDGLLVAANDAIAVAPVLREALGKGVNVVTYDADVSPEARQWYVERADPSFFAKGLVDALADAIGDEGAFAIVTTTNEAPLQGRWIAEMEAYAAACHPGLVWLGTEEGRDNPVTSATVARNLVGRHGEALKAIVTLSYAATPAAAGVLGELDRCAMATVVGVGTPNAAKPHFGARCLRALVLWSPADLGYAAVHVLRAAADGTLEPGATELIAGRLGKLRIDGSAVLLGLPTVFTADTVGDFDF